jgi:tetratricopeptide (TPR) repeat protein
MRKGSALLQVFVLAAGLCSSGAAAQQDAQDSSEAPPPGPPRVIGQAQTQAEFDAYNAATQATLAEEKIQLARAFLEQFPESGLAPHAHKLVAFAYMEVNDFDQFVDHSQEALSELPGDPDIIPHLARVYAEQGNTVKAIQLAKQGQEIWETIEKPEGLPSDKWSAKKDEALADLHYSHGLALLRKVSGMIGDKSTVLKRAAQHLEASAGFDPSFDRAYLRLGSAHTMLNDGEKAILNFARAASLGREAAQAATERLKKVYEFVHKGTDGLEELIQREREFIQKRVAEKEAELERLRQEEEVTQPTLPKFALPE